MLRRKLLVVLGSLIMLLLVAALSAILLLHGVLEDLVDASTEAVAGAAECQQLETSMRRLEADLIALRRDPDIPVAEAVQDAQSLRRRAQDLGPPRVPPEVAPVLEGIAELLPRLQGELQAVAAAGGQPPRTEALEAALDVAFVLRSEVAELGRMTQEHSLQTQDRLVKRFRVSGLLVGIVFLLLLNATIIVLLRAAAMVLRPVDRLVEASRRLGREEFDHRVEVDHPDEFGELARAYNGLAEQLQANEQRKLETLQQVARTLHHELNNAISVIDLQLTLLGRRSADRTVTEPLQRIQQTLHGMSHTIDALKHVRRIVLTDYLAGVKMIDLQRSVETEATPASGQTAGTAETKA